MTSTDDKKQTIIKWAAFLAFALTCFHLGTGILGQLPDLLQRSIHVSGALSLAFLLSIGASRWRRGIDILFALASLLIGVYMVYRYDAMSSIDYWASDMDIAVGTVTIVIILEAARRTVGLFFPVLALIVISYALFGNYFPGVLAHRGMDPIYMVEVVFGTTRGIWGVITGVSATVIAIFVIFGSVLFRTGGGETFMDLSLFLSGRSTAGVGKVATIASGLFGSLSGSAAANIATTGAFTIPMMKRLAIAHHLRQPLRHQHLWEGN